MPQWLVIFMLLSGTLVGLKVAYALCTSLALPATRGALYVSTPRSRISEILEAVPMQEGQILVDLGCGDGRVLRMASRLYRIRGVGYELNLLAYIKAKLQCLGCHRIKVKWQNFWQADLSTADVVFCYLFPDVMKDMSVKLQKELKNGATVISCNFPIPDLELQSVLRPSGSLINDPVYIYTIAKSDEILKSLFIPQRTQSAQSKNLLFQSVTSVHSVSSVVNL